MGMRKGSLVAATLAVFVLAACVACTAADYEAYVDRDDPSAAAEGLDQGRADAVLRYVEAERTQIPKIQALLPGVYSEVRAEATMEEQSGDRGIPAGTYAVAHFHYTYTNNTDWSSTIDYLDANRGVIDRFCEESVFPAMAEAGVTTPMGVTFNYSDERAEFGPVWSHACSKWQ